VGKRFVENLLQELTLDNGLVLEVRDESFNYYANFWNLKIVISGTIKVKPAYLEAICPANPYEQKAKRALGGAVPYHRELTRIGVREGEKEADIQRLLDSFVENSLPYLGHPSFPERMVISHWKRLADEIKGKERKSNE
jgi:hypothetical protein